ncbi:MAG: hypothetical protein HY876_01275 [Coriobacteriales bacterium]|nr:hypothetical protein [Coriobacteriales bacterium]
MFARVSRYEVPLEKLHDDIEGVDETQKKVSDMPGSLGLFYLVDRATGQTMSITLWDSEESMRASESGASALRDQTMEAASAHVTSIERYEVVSSPAKVPVWM